MRYKNADRLVSDVVLGPSNQKRFLFFVHIILQIGYPTDSLREKYISWDAKRDKLQIIRYRYSDLSEAKNIEKCLILLHDVSMLPIYRCTPSRRHPSSKM